MQQRFILYLFIVLAAVVFIPGLSDNRTVVLVTILICGPAIVVLSMRSWSDRQRLTGLGRTVVEAGPIFGTLITLLAVAEVFGFHVLGGQ
jgi:hypothetical protein